MSYFPDYLIQFCDPKRAVYLTRTSENPLTMTPVAKGSGQVRTYRTQRVSAEDGRCGSVIVGSAILTCSARARTLLHAHIRSLPPYSRLQHAFAELDVGADLAMCCVWCPWRGSVLCRLDSYDIPFLPPLFQPENSIAAEINPK